jgi:hypothetical protein
MRLAEKLLVRGAEWKVYRKARLTFKGVRVDGLTMPNRKIYIDSTLRGHEYETTLVHELMHAAAVERGVDIGTKSHEHIVSTAEPWVYDATITLLERSRNR